MKPNHVPTRGKPVGTSNHNSVVSIPGTTAPLMPAIETEGGVFESEKLQESCNRNEDRVSSFVLTLGIGCLGKAVKAMQATSDHATKKVG